MIVRSDALHFPLADGTVDLVVTSPPYFALRSYQDGGQHYDGQIGSEPTPAAFVDALVAVTAEMARVLKPAGSIFVNLGDKYAGSGGHNNSGLADGSSGRNRGAANRLRRDAPTSYNKNTSGIRDKSLMGLPWRYALRCVDDLGLILRAEIIWDKPNPLPEPVTDRVRRSHEQWFHLVKEPKYYAAVDELRRPYNGHRTLSRRRKLPGDGKHDQRAPFLEQHPLGSLPGSVWEIPSEPLVIPAAVRAAYNLPDHYAAFPQEWPRRLILGWSAPGAVVLDPFGGTGTVAMVARALGRHGLNFDLSADYCRLAHWRIHRSGHAAKTENRTWAERQGQLL